MQTINKGGDVLARGNASCVFPPAGGNVSQKKWDKMWEGFDPEAYKKNKPAENGTGIKETATIGVAH
jgi:hypothetical protein